ncbi:MAG: hypothetical protein E7664_03995 [Ruminococcaceae bacterium]|nr:hypothetical protein [Oscillospiraceae bacterium]
MAIINFIPAVWSETLYRELDKQYIAVAHCNREFEGEIKEKGSKVRICGIGDIAINDYTKNNDMAMPQDLSDTVRDLPINYAKYFNFQIDDIDRAQTSVNLMEGAMRVAASALANEADKVVFGLWDKAEIVRSGQSVTADNILDLIIATRTALYENNVTDTSEVVLEVSPAVAALILKAKIATGTDNTAELENGCLGMVAGCKVFVSNNIVQDDSEGPIYHQCLMRTKRAIAFAEQLSEINAYRPEKRFADAVKGLHLYGAKVVYPKELAVLSLNLD